MNHYHSDGKHLDYTPGSDISAGTLVQVGGQAGIVDNDIAANTLGAVTVRGTVKLDNSGVIFADGATVGYDASGNNAVAGGGGDFDCGTCVGGATASEQVVVLLNG